MSLKTVRSEEYLTRAATFFREHPDATATDFRRADSSAYFGLMQNRQRWRLGTIPEEMKKIGINVPPGSGYRTHGTKPGKQKQAQAPRRDVPSKEERKPLPVIVVNGQNMDAEQQLKLLDNPVRGIWWNSTSHEVRKALLQFPEIRKKVERKGWRTD